MRADDPSIGGDPIEQLLAGTYRDPETGELVRAESRAVVIADSLDGAEVELVAALDTGPHLAVISDRTTHEVLGARVERALRSRFSVQSLVLDHPHADSDTVARLLAALEPRTDAVIAVGSGTINDLSKMVASERAIPQAVFATAPSMNGYTSVSASIASDGIKRSLRVRTPVAAFFDLAIIAAAPRRLIRSGLGDSACRSTAQADWLLAHLLLDRPYRELPFLLLADDERALFAQPEALVAGDRAAMRHLVRTLVLSGFGMTIANGSHPASQGEHLLSHYLEMHWPPATPVPFHGEQVGVCAIAMARLQARLLAPDTPPRLRPSPVDRAALVHHFGADAGDACWREFAPKRLDAAATDALNARLARDWDAIRTRIARVHVDAAAIHAILTAAGAATTPEALGCPPALFADALAHARELRNRYTFLDLAADLGSGPTCET